MKYFNTAGPCDPAIHYMVPAEPRLPGARPLIDEGQYFVLHAPRQTGKTTVLRSLARSLTDEGQMVAVHFSCETGEPAGDNVGAAEKNLLVALQRSARLMRLPVELMPPDPWPDAPDGSQLTLALEAWARSCSRPLVLFFDEIDALRGESLRSVLRQLRDGFASRPAEFPAAVVLCGLRDVRDYKAAAGGDGSRLGTSSPFNIKVASLRLGDFTFDEVRDLYLQHSAETGQVFSDDAVALAFEYTQGQPWLVNALAREVVREMNVPVSDPITPAHIDQAKERLIVARATHLDSLAARLQEPRVVRVIQPLIAGNLAPTDSAYNDDLAYLQDLGLLAPTSPAAIANPIYREVILRVLATGVENSVTADPRSFIRPDGTLNFTMILEEFADFWRQHGEILLHGGGSYHETSAQLSLMAYLHRVVNGGGYIDREYGVGRGRIDLLIRWPHTNNNGTRTEQREAIELKVWNPKQRDPLHDGLTQLDRYLDRLNLNHGTLIIFDRRPDAQPIPQRTTITQTTTPTGRTTTLLRA